MLGPGSAHYHCQIRAIASSIIVKNPRPELYEHSLAQSSDGVQCKTSHILDNQAIEISECTVVSVLCMIMLFCGGGRGGALHVFISFLWLSLLNISIYWHNHNYWKNANNTSLWRHGSYVSNRTLTDADIRPGIISKAAFQFYSTWIA